MVVVALVVVVVGVMVMAAGGSRRRFFSGGSRHRGSGSGSCPRRSTGVHVGVSKNRDFPQKTSGLILVFLTDVC